MFRILVPVDFEDSTAKACHYALRLASGAPEAEILLLHCFRDYLTDPWDLPPAEDRDKATASEEITERVIHRNEAEERDKLRALRQQLQSGSPKTHVHLTTAFVNGMPEDVIPAEAQRFGANLVVMGTAGEDSLSRSLFGTITTKMAEEVKVPVLSVPVQASDRQLTRVLYATDFDNADAQAIADLQGVLAPFRPQILCLHVSTDEAADQEKLANLEAEVAGLTTAGNIRYMLLEDENVAETLEDFVEKEHVDLLAVTNRKRSFFDSLLHPSLTKKLVLEAEVPLLIFHSQGN